MSLTSYLKSKLISWVPFEEIPGLEFQVAFLSREELNKIRNAATRITFNPKSRVKEEEFNIELFGELIIKEAILGWKGLTLERASLLIPLEIPEGVDPNTELDFSVEESKVLFRNSTALDLWLNSIISDLETFRTVGKR